MVVLDATAGSDAEIDIVSSEYATVAAEQTALEQLADIVADQIVARLALYARANRAGEVKPPRPASAARSISLTATIRFYLFHGPDEAQSRALGERLLESLGAIKFLVAAGAIKSDPAHLADEAGAMSLFGGTRVIWIEPATKEIDEAVRRCLTAAVAESPVVAIAGALPRLGFAQARGSFALGDRLCLLCPEGLDAERMVIDLGRRVGLKIAPRSRRGSPDAAGNDQAIVAQELQKLALYIDASPHTPKELDHDAIDAVGADTAEGDFLRLADLALARRRRRARRRTGAAAGRRDRRRSRSFVRFSAAAHAGAGAGPRRARRARRCRHDVTR